MATNGQTPTLKGLAAEDKDDGELSEDCVELREDGVELREGGVELREGGVELLEGGVELHEGIGRGVDAPRVLPADVGSSSKARRGVVVTDTARISVGTAETLMLMLMSHVMTTNMMMPMMIIMMEARRSSASCVLRLLMIRNLWQNI